MTNLCSDEPKMCSDELNFVLATYTCADKGDENILCNFGEGTKISKKTREGLRKFCHVFIMSSTSTPARTDDLSLTNDFISQL